MFTVPKKDTRRKPPEILTSNTEEEKSSQREDWEAELGGQAEGTFAKFQRRGF